MEWTVVLAGPARKSLRRIPAGDKTRFGRPGGDAARPVPGRYPEAAGASRFSSACGQLAHPLRGRTRTQASGRGSD